MSFRAHWEQPWLRYGGTGADGQPLAGQVIELSGPSMMHDMAITARHSILLDLNVAYVLDAVAWLSHAAAQA